MIKLALRQLYRLLKCTNTNIDGLDGEGIGAAVLIEQQVRKKREKMETSGCEL